MLRRPRDGTNDPAPDVKDFKRQTLLRMQSDRSSVKNFADCGKSATPFGLVDPGNQALGACHIGSIVVTKGVKHQLLLLADPEEIENSKAE